MRKPDTTSTLRVSKFLDEPLMLLSHNHHIGGQAHGVNAHGMAFCRAGLYDLPLLDGAGQSVSKSGFDGHSQARPDDGQDAVQVKPFVHQGHFLDPVTLGAEKTPQPADTRLIAGLPGVAHQNVFTQEEDITPFQKRPRALAILGGRNGRGGGIEA